MLFSAAFKFKIKDSETERDNVVTYCCNWQRKHSSDHYIFRATENNANDSQHVVCRVLVQTVTLTVIVDFFKEKVKG